MRIRCACATVILILIALPSVSAQDRIDGAVMSVQAAVASGDGETVRRVVASSIQVYLEQQGIDVLLPGDTRAADSDFTVRATLTVTGQNVETVLELVPADSAGAIATVSSTARVDLTIDRSIATLTARLLNQARAPVGAAAATRREQASTVQPDVMIGPQQTQTTSQPPNRLVIVTTSFSPLISVGAAATVLGFGPGGTLALSIVPFASDTIGFGLLARGVTARATGVALTADLVAVPIALTVTVAGDGWFAPFARLGGGASILSASNAVVGSYTKIVPYASADLGARIWLLGPIALTAGVGFDAYFEGSMLILGFSPGVGVMVGL